MGSISIFDFFEETYRFFSLQVIMNTERLQAGASALHFIPILAGTNTVCHLLF
jgi:hypothetical protein